MKNVCQVNMGRFARDTFVLAACIAAQCLPSDASGQQTGDAASNAKAIGEIRIDARGMGAKTTSKDLESILMEKFGITRAPTDFQYNEKLNVNGGIQSPLILATSSIQAPKQWLDVVVPFGTEEHWTHELSQIVTVAGVNRKPVSDNRSDFIQDFGVSGDRIANITAPLFTIRRPVGTMNRLWQSLEAAIKECYPVAVVSPLLPGGTHVVDNRKGFAINRAGKVLPDLPKWQKFQVNATSLNTDDGTKNLSLIFLGFYAEGLGSIEPPPQNYKSMLLEDDETPLKPFQTHASAIAARIEHRLLELMK